MEKLTQKVTLEKEDGFYSIWTNEIKKINVTLCTNIGDKSIGKILINAINKYIEKPKNKLILKKGFEMETDMKLMDLCIKKAKKVCLSNKLDVNGDSILKIAISLFIPQQRETKGIKID